MSNAYLQMDVRTARPEELVMRLFARAIRCAKQAHDLESGDELPDRIRLLGRAIDIVHELQNALDLERGGEIAHNLHALYDFVGERLLSGGMKRQREPIAEAIGVLETLAEPWGQLGSADAQQVEASP